LKLRFIFLVLWEIKKKWESDWKHGKRGKREHLIGTSCGWGAVGGAKRLLFSPIYELTTQTNCVLDIIGPIYVPSINLISGNNTDWNPFNYILSIETTLSYFLGFISCKTNIFRPELTYDQKISRVSAAKTIMKNVENYTMGVSYGDSQRFRYSKTFPQLFLYVFIIHVTYLHLLLLLLVLKTSEQYLCITNQKRRRFPHCSCLELYVYHQLNNFTSWW
jgi:hypothetical protein